MASSHNAPPATLDGALEVGSDEWRAPGFYQLLTALVVPRPVDFDDFEERSPQPRSSAHARRVYSVPRLQGFPGLVGTLPQCGKLLR
jgi:hypothetical protein